MSGYPFDAACAGLSPMFDFTIWGESRDEQEARHHRARAICRRCPVIDACRNAINWQTDEGVRGGMLLPEKRHVDRPPRERRRYEIAHGSPQGARAHYRRGEKPCDACYKADQRYQQDRRKWAS